MPSIRAGVRFLSFLAVPQLSEGVCQGYSARVEGGSFLLSHGYSKHESKFFSRFARPIVRSTVLISTFPFFIGILVPVYVRVITFTIEVPHRLQYTVRHDGGHASFVGVC